MLSILKKGANLCQRNVFNTAKRNCVSVPWVTRKTPLKIEKIGGKYLMTLIPGSPSSAVAVDCLASVLECLGAPLTWETLAGNFAEEKDFNNLLVSIKRNGIAIKGNLDPYETDRMFKIAMNKNTILRRTLDLHTFIIEIKSFRGLKHLMKLHQEIDVVLIRQNTEGEYTQLEHSPLVVKRGDRVVELLRVITRNNSHRLAECAFRYAERKNRKKVSCLHRRDAMPMSETTFLEGFQEVAQKYTKIEHSIMSFGVAFEQFMKNPKYLDVVVMGGLDGMILQNYLIGMIGGGYLTPGMNVGDQAVVMEPAARLRDSSVNVNPTAYILCGAALLDLLGRTDLSEIIRESIEEVFLDKVFPPDLGGKINHDHFTKAVIRQIRKRRPTLSCKYDSAPKLKPYTPPKEWPTGKKK